MTHIIMIEEIIKLDTDQIVVTEEISIDKVEVDPGINKNMEEGILEVMWDCIKILEDKIVKENTEVIIGMKTIAEREVGVGPEKDNFQGITIIIEGAIEAQAVVDQGLDQEQVQIEIELGAINVENMTILWEIAPHLRKKER